MVKALHRHGVSISEIVRRTGHEPQWTANLRAERDLQRQLIPGP